MRGQNNTADCFHADRGSGFFLVSGADLLPVVSKPGNRRLSKGGAQRNVVVTLFNKPRRLIYTETPNWKRRTKCKQCDQQLRKSGTKYSLENLNYTSNEEHQSRVAGKNVWKLKANINNGNTIRVRFINKYGQPRGLCPLFKAACTQHSPQ